MFKIEITFLYDMKNNFSIMAFLKILKINPKSGYTGLFHASSLFFFFLCVILLLLGVLFIALHKNI